MVLTISRHQIAKGLLTETSRPFRVCPGLWSPQAAPTSYWRDDLVQELHAGSLPNLFDDGSQLLIGLFEVAWGMGKVGVALKRQNLTKP